MLAVDIRAEITRRLNRSTQDSYTRCHGHTDITRLRVLPVCQSCVAWFRLSKVVCRYSLSPTVLLGDI